MSALRPSASETASGGASPAAGPGRANRWARALAALLAALLLGGVMAAGAGFLWFAESMPRHEIALRRNADGIVVLTGGASRIADAIELLAAGHGKRLLISGVHRATTAREIARTVPSHKELVACCVDLDHSAVNTVGNAAETRRWAKDRGFQSLIVVTSNYHMPRSMAELAHQMPDIELIAFPVISDKLRAEPWWSSLPTAKLLISEYLKYMVAQIRIRLEPASDATGVARARSHIRS